MFTSCCSCCMSLWSLSFPEPCGGKECQNDGELDVQSCTCRCKGVLKGDTCGKCHTATHLRKKGERVGKRERERETYANEQVSQHHADTGGGGEEGEGEIDVCKRESKSTSRRHARARTHTHTHVHTNTHTHTHTHTHTYTHIYSLSWAEKEGDRETELRTLLHKDLDFRHF